MVILDSIQRDVLIQLHEWRSGCYFRKEEEKNSVLSLAKLGLVCDPHGDEDTEALFTRITDAGFAVAEAEIFVDDDGLTEVALEHFTWASDILTVNFDAEDYQTAAKVIMILNNKIKMLKDELNAEPKVSNNHV